MMPNALWIVVVSLFHLELCVFRIVRRMSHLMGRHPDLASNLTCRWKNAAVSRCRIWVCGTPCRLHTVEKRSDEPHVSGYPGDVSSFWSCPPYSLPMIVLSCPSVWGFLWLCGHFGNRSRFLPMLFGIFVTVAFFRSEQFPVSRRVARDRCLLGCCLAYCMQAR